VKEMENKVKKLETEKKELDKQVSYKVRIRKDKYLEKMNKPNSTDNHL
jgi:hypothetical protein